MGEVNLELSMAQGPNLGTRIYVVWKTRRPLPSTPKKSSSFFLWGDQWNLQISFTTSSFTIWDYYAISLHRGTREEPLEDQFHVTTFLESKVNSEIPPVFSIATVQSTRQVLWECCENEISDFNPDFLEDGEFEIVCFFHGDASPVLPSKNETVHLSTQTDFDPLLCPTLKLSNQPNGKSSADVSVQSCLDFTADLEKLSLDLSKLLESKSFPDVKLKCGALDIPVHKSILAARSKVFTAMFRNDMVEKETNVVHVTDMDPTVLALFLKYIYSGKVSGLSEDIVPSLYTVADKYDVHALEKACSDWMVEHLSEENCLRFLVLADAHCDEQFKDTVVNYIVEHLGLIGKESWTRFNDEHPRLSVVVYQKSLVRKCSRQMPQAEE